MEPCILKKGKEFHKEVQKNFKDYSKDGIVNIEAFVPFDYLKKNTAGRADILIDELSDFVTIIEIKSTDWDKIAEKNIRRNLYRHQRQIFKYIYKYFDEDGLDVCLGIIYPQPPSSNIKKEYIENCMLNIYSLPVYWYCDIKSTEN